ncbi:hypothetical protein SCHPADRAFT_820103 [Schizopora paradoxa]|uniref:Adenylate kinase n=1 Tax=Schizopora paradoxa TaxID=27342 RepID=A0A0H2S987_9AGAM|nr:hypothetical protein SCHPADRAFT_820103 [Schizopora paradoxa]
MSSDTLPPLKGDGNGVYRVHIVGNSGTGKFTLGDELSEILGVPCIHLDTLFWKSGWVQSNSEDFRQRVLEALGQSEKGWIVDGNYTKFLSEELSTATDVIWLDTPFLLYFPRIFIRTMGRLFGHGPPCAPGCDETVRSVFFDSDSILWWAITHHYPIKRRYTTLMITDGIEVGGNMRRIGGWGRELRKWKEDVWKMVNKIE